MAVIGIDLGGTKLSAAVFGDEGLPCDKETVALDGRTGSVVGEMILNQVRRLHSACEEPVEAIGVSVPGISDTGTGTVWAPNIPGWESYPLSEEIGSYLSDDTIKVAVESDRSCYILGETWKGAAHGVNDAIFIAVGTGIGAGILIDGVILRGHADIAGSIGWMALDRPYKDAYTSCGCFEYYASGDGIARTARLLLEKENACGTLGELDAKTITAHDVFRAYDEGDRLAAMVLDNTVELWGMAVANLVSIFNPEMIVFGGGVFGPAIRFLERIHSAASQWAQPISIQQVTLVASELGEDAGLIGAGRLAMMQRS